MHQANKPIEGTVSAKHQITIPAQIWEELGLQAGHKIEFRLGQDKNVLELRVKRPDPVAVLHNILEQYDVGVLQQETNNDATKTLQKNRWGED